MRKPKAATVDDVMDRGPLAGRRVIELGPGPIELTGMMLADMGAEVVSVKRPSVRMPGEQRKAKEPDTRSQIVRGKRALGIDLQDANGRAVLEALCLDADILIEGFRPGVADRLGAGYEALAAKNPGLIYCSVTGYGQDGPYRDLPGHDINYLAVSGLLDLVGKPGEPPTIPLNLIADYAGASLHAAVGILLALIARDVTGKGQHVDISYTDTTFALLSASPMVEQYFLDGRDEPTRGMGLFAGEFPFYGTYQCMDGRLLAIGALEPHLWKKVCDALGCSEFVDAGYKSSDQSGTPGVRQREARTAMEKVFVEKSAADWFEELAPAGVPCSIVLTLGEAVSNEQLVSRGMVLKNRPGAPVVQAASPIRLSETPARIERVTTSAPVGDREWFGQLGLDAVQIDALVESGVIECA